LLTKRLLQQSGGLDHLNHFAKSASAYASARGLNGPLVSVCLSVNKAAQKYCKMLFFAAS